MAGVFSGKAETADAVREGEVEKLHAKIGQVVVERVFCRKPLVDEPGSEATDDCPREPAAFHPAAMPAGVDQPFGLYYQPASERPLNLELMKLLDHQFLETPGYGSRQMARCLRRQGYTVGRKWVQRLMAKIGLTAIYQAPGTTIPHPEHRVYKYLLRDTAVDRPN